MKAMLRVLGYLLAGGVAPVAAALTARHIDAAAGAAVGSLLGLAGAALLHAVGPMRLVVISRKKW